MNEKLSLKEIAGWQLSKEQNEVTLPAMQRGFVWSPEQIEALWDSLLRKFPIGSFLFSKTKDGAFNLLDGQQRATSISLGFYNPFSGKMYSWSIKGESEHLPVVWIDIKPGKGKLSEDNRFLIRVVTRSQPWGYNVNHEKLDISRRKEALVLFQKHKDNTGKGYTQFANTTYFPVEASHPVPLSFFFEAIEQGSNEKSAIAKYVLKLCENHLPPYIGKNKSAFIINLKNNLCANLEGIAQAALDIYNNTQTNYDVLDESVLTDSGAATDTDAVNDDEAEAENPTLFVRINSGGTTLGGEELIYSIYKATFPNAKGLVENIGMGYISPTQIISIAARIAYTNSHRHDYPARMTVQRFQSLIEQKLFIKELNILIGENAEQSPIRACFEKAKNILSLEGVDGFKKEDESLMPPVLVKEFIKKNQDLFLLLIYWLSKNDKLEINPDLARKIAARLLTFSWFTFDRKKRTVEKTVKALWEFSDKPDFWEKSITGIVTGETPLLAVPIHPDLLRDYYFTVRVENRFYNRDECWDLINGAREPIDAAYKKISSYIRDDPDNEIFRANDNFQAFINNLMSCKSMVLFAQREYINREFTDFNQLDDLDDTNAPWDWDHIYPSSWLYRQRNVPKIIKNWNGCIGNLRALALQDNRTQGNRISPADRLSDEKDRCLSFVNDDWQYWQYITGEIKAKDNLGRNDKLRHYHAVVSRMLNIYRRWWDDLHIWEVTACKK